MRNVRRRKIVAQTELQTAYAHIYFEKNSVHCVIIPFFPTKKRLIL